MIEDTPVHIWFFGVKDFYHVVNTKELSGVVSQEEYKKALSFHIAQQQQSRLASYYVLRCLLTRLHPTIAPAQWRFKRGEMGKPFVANTTDGREIHFSLSRSEDKVVIAISQDHHVGVDVEWMGVKSYSEGFINRFFHPLEVENLMTMESSQSLKECDKIWTFKEAHLKRLGTGLLEGSSHFYLVPTRDRSKSYQVVGEGKGYVQFWQLRDYGVALALTQEQDANLTELDHEKLAKFVNE